MLQTQQHSVVVGFHLMFEKRMMKMKMPVEVVVLKKR